MKNKQCLQNVVSVLTACVSASAAETSFGTLPPGMLSVSEMSDVPAEICRDHIFDPSTVSGRLPPGYRLVSAEECAKEDPAVADFVKINPGYARYAVGSLCFVSAGTFIVDGVRIHSPGLAPIAFWWARAEGPRDSRMQGKAQWLQLASWYSRDIKERAQVLATDPMAQFTDIRITEVEPRVWHLRLVLTDEVIEGEVRCSGELTKRRPSEEKFMSVPFSGDSAEFFWVFSYFGHHHQPANGKWQSKGSGVFSAAFQIPDEAGTFGTAFQKGWSALSGLYKRKQ
jgi:hypothetical protein